MEKWLSCDWGTSSFRLRVIASDTLRVIAEEISDEGSVKTFERWKKTGKPEADRIDFYLQIIREHINKLQKTATIDIKGLPVVISGMATSTVGMKELAYKNIPFKLDGSDLTTEWINHTYQFPHDMLMISGAKTNEDVMRGEETKLVGAEISSRSEKQVFIIPGTHSKHAWVNQNEVIAFETYMTGEFFDLLSGKSILAVAVEENKMFSMPEHREAFEEGLKKATETNLLHASFLVRTNDLFKKHTKGENFYYLSGLMIGHELKDLTMKLPCPITLLSNEKFTALYEHAIKTLYTQHDVPELTVIDGDEALIKGQYRIYNKHLSRK